MAFYGPQDQRPQEQGPKERRTGLSKPNGALEDAEYRPTGWGPKEPDRSEENRDRIY